MHAHSVNTSDTLPVPYRGCALGHAVYKGLSAWWAGNKAANPETNGKERNPLVAVDSDAFYHTVPEKVNS